MQQATTRLMEYGILGIILVIVLGISSYVIVTLWKSMELRNAQLRADFEEMRKMARGDVFNSADLSRKVIENNTLQMQNNTEHLKHNERLMDEIRLLLVKILEGKM